MGTPSRKDGGFGWAVVFAFFTSSIIIDGLRYAFGLLYIEFLVEFNQGKGATAWIGSVLISVYNIIGPVLAVGINRFGVRISTITGSIIATVGLVASSFANQIYLLFFTYGIIQGIGLGMMFLSGWVAVSRYFEKKRGLALGIAQCGCGVGAFAISPLLKMLIDEYSWRGAMLILAGACLNCCVLGMVYRPMDDVFEYTMEEMQDLNGDKNTIHVAVHDCTNESNNEKNKQLTPDGACSENGSLLIENHNFSPNHKCKKANGKVTLNKTSAEANRKVKKKNLLRNILCLKNEPEDVKLPRTFADMREEQLNNYKLRGNKPHLASITLSSCRSVNSIHLSPIVLGSNASLEQIMATRRRKAQIDNKISDIDDVQNDTKSKNSDSTEQVKFSWSILEKLFPKRLVTDVKLILMMAAAVFYCMPTFIPISLIADYGRIVGCSEAQSVWFVSAIGIGGTIGRVIFGFVVDVPCINRIWCLAGTMTVCSVFTFFLPLLTTFPLLMLYSLSYGICIGSLYVVPAIILMDVFGEDLIPQTMGVLMYVSGVSAILGTPIAGWLFDATQSYTASFLFCGGLFLVSAVLHLFVLCVPDKENTKKNMNNAKAENIDIFVKDTSATA